jgi:hydrogenase-4 component B
VIESAAQLLLGAVCMWAIAVVLATLAGTRCALVACALVSALGGALAAAGGICVAAEGARAMWTIGAGNLVGAVTLRLDPLAAAFIVLLGLVALAIGLFAPRYHVPSRGSVFYLSAYNLALLASLGVLVAGNATLFLAAWESMTLFSYLLILRQHRIAGVAKAAFLFLALGEVGFALIVAAFAILATQTGTLDLTAMASRSEAVPLARRSTVFVLALLGFGFKAGLVPLHVWLPAAHPVAPADGSGFLSGMVIKLGVYGLMLFAFELLGSGPTWWGVLTTAIGAFTAVVGVLYAAIERDFKRLLAYSSIENIGIIVTAVGAAAIFLTYGQRALGALLLIAALYHVINDGTYKTLLFMEAGVIEHATGTRDLDQLGGLIDRLKASTVISLIGVLGIAGLPPLNGFVSEWLVFQGLFQDFRIEPLAGVVLVVAGATLALSGGLAIMAFARAFGIAFLGMPRSQNAAHARETGQPLLGPGSLAVACIALSIGTPTVILVLDHVVWSVIGVELQPNLLIANLTVIPAHTKFSSFSPTYLAVFLLCVSGAIVYLLCSRSAPRTKPHCSGLGRRHSRIQTPNAIHRHRLRQPGARHI